MSNTHGFTKEGAQRVVEVVRTVEKGGARTQRRHRRRRPTGGGGGGGGDTAQVVYISDSIAGNTTVGNGTLTSDVSVWLTTVDGAGLRTATGDQLTVTHSFLSAVNISSGRAVVGIVIGNHLVNVDCYEFDFTPPATP